MSDTIAHRQFASSSPPLFEFFETFHVLVHPSYTSKYFPAQGTFEALGEKFTGHPIVGIWLSSALACAAMVWMLQAWIAPTWALLGGVIFALQFGIYSYWSQSYWGGMAAALGGVLFFGTVRRLWDQISWKNSLWLAIGLILLANSRPLEGLVAALPASALLLHNLWTTGRMRDQHFLFRFLTPLALVLIPSSLAMGAYNRSITGSAFKTPYMLHEQQYQESPPFLFQSLRPKIEYTNPQLREYYDGWEVRAYERSRRLWFWPLAVGERIRSWWGFYCGILLSVPLALPGFLHKRKLRIFQTIALAGAIVVFLIIGSHPDAWKVLIDLVAILQVFIWWNVFTDFWSRLALATCVLVLSILFFTKWIFPHYFAPAACLVLYLQVAGLRQIWEWRSSRQVSLEGLSRSERRRMIREQKNSTQPVPWLRAVVYLLPIACFFSLVWRLEARVNGWDDHSELTRGALLLNDWSLRRAEIEKWLEQQPTPQLVFVRYSPQHPIQFEWVYNHADIMHSHVIWAHDFGEGHNRLLLNALPGRTVWLIEPDYQPTLVPYPGEPNTPLQTSATVHEDAKENLNW